MVEFLETILDRLKDKRPVTHNVNGDSYAVKADGTLGAYIEPVPFVAAPVLGVNTLTGFVGAYRSGVDDFNAEDVAVQVGDHLTVELVSLRADEFGRRRVWIRAKHLPDTGFVFGQYYKTEDFLIAFRSSFYFNESAVKVQKLISTLSAENSIAVADDGMSQSITVKVGAVTKATVDIPADGIPLVPWRTFREAAPVESKFLLRMRQVKDDLPQVALFEIDAKWRVETIASVAAYLREQLPDARIIA